ncbi:MAG: nucleoside monophosphate kinase [Patescibacteria group bacterium]
MHNKKRIIIILGRAGSGKGTQSKLLEEKFGFKCIGSGDILRARFKQKDFTGNKLDKVLSGGGLAPTAMIFKLWVDELEKIKNNDLAGFIIDGSPRKIFEAQLMDQALEWYEWDKCLKIFYIDISRKESFSRLTTRKLCGECGRIIPYIGEFKKLEKCDKCGGELKVRHDDHPEGIKIRLDLFEEETRPIIDYYKKTDRKVIDINGEQSIEKVFADILKHLK